LVVEVTTRQFFLPFAFRLEEMTKSLVDPSVILPVELIIYIIQFLEAVDVVAMSRLSKRWNRICQEDKLWLVLYQNYFEVTTKSWKQQFVEMYSSTSITLKKRLA